MGELLLRVHAVRARPLAKFFFTRTRARAVGLAVSLFTEESIRSKKKKESARRLQENRLESL